MNFVQVHVNNMDKYMGTKIKDIKFILLHEKIHKIFTKKTM